MRRIALGMVSGLAGTAAMTSAQELRRRGNSDGEEEPAPAQVARKALGLVGIRPPQSWTPYLTHAMHWSYGTGVGTVYALVHRDGNAPRDGLLFGVAVWAASYAQLVPLGIYEPPWKYSPRELAEDVGYHAAYGLAVAATYAALAD